MPARSSSARLADMVEAMDRLHDLMETVSLEEFRGDWQRQWLGERGIEIISEASRHLPDAMKARHPDRPWRKVAGIGNVLRHAHERIAAPVLWMLVNDDLPPLDRACRAELAIIQGRPGGTDAY